MPFQGDPFADHPLVQDYYNHKPFKKENVIETRMDQIEIMINGKGPFLAFVTDQPARRNSPEDILIVANVEVWPPK